MDPLALDPRRRGPLGWEGAEGGLPWPGGGVQGGRPLAGPRDAVAGEGGQKLRQG